VKKVLALALIVAGVLALVYHGFSFTKERHEARLGPLAVQVDEKKRVEIPVWAGVVAVAGGVVLLLADGGPGKKK
jgi:hypothetical protein